MEASIVSAGAAFFLQLLAFVLAIGAEMRRSTGMVVPDEYDERSYCAYDSDASTAYGLGAFTSLLVAEILISASTRCIFLPSHSARVGSSGGRAPSFFALCSFAISWLAFVAAEACLLAGSARNAYHTKYVGYYLKRDLTSCAALRKGVFAAASVLVLLTFAASVCLYWSNYKANSGGWIKHRNEEGVSMTSRGDSNRGDLVGDVKA